MKQRRAKLIFSKKRYLAFGIEDYQGVKDYLYFEYVYMFKLRLGIKRISALEKKKNRIKVSFLLKRLKEIRKII